MTASTVDLSDFALWRNGFPDDVFTELRHSRPLFRHGLTPGVAKTVKRDFWMTTKHRHAVRLHRDHESFTAVDGPLIQPADLFSSYPTIINMDPPALNKRRKLISNAFNPRAIAKLEDGIRATRARMPSSSLAIARGLNALEISLRRLLSAGGSMLMMVGYDENRSAGWMSGPSTAVNESASRCRRTACRCLVAIQKSRLTVLATPGVKPWRNSGRLCRSSVNTSSGKPLRHNAKSDRSTVEAVIRNLDSFRRPRREGCRYVDSPYRRPQRALTFNA